MGFCARVRRRVSFEVGHERERVRVRVCERVRVRAWSQIRDERSVDGDGRTDGELGFGGRGLRSARVREGQRATAEGQRATAREQISRVDVPRSVLPQLLRDGRGVRYHESTHAQDRPLAKHIKERPPSRQGPNLSPPARPPIRLSPSDHVLYNADRSPPRDRRQAVQTIPHVEVVTGLQNLAHTH